MDPEKRMQIIKKYIPSGTVSMSNAQNTITRSMIRVFKKLNIPFKSGYIDFIHKNVKDFSDRLIHPEKIEGRFRKSTYRICFLLTLQSINSCLKDDRLSAVMEEIKSYKFFDAQVFANVDYFNNHNDEIIRELLAGN